MMWRTKVGKKALLDMESAKIWSLIQDMGVKGGQTYQLYVKHAITYLEPPVI